MKPAAVKIDHCTVSGCSNHFTTPRAALLSVLIATVVAPAVQAQTPNGACGLPSGTMIFGMTADNRVLEYQVNTTQGPLQVGTITITRNSDGLTTADNSLVGIDFRPADNDDTALYAVTDQGDIKKLNPYTAAVNSLIATTPVSNLAIPFQGGLHTTMDFNPMLDAIRLVGSNDQNFAVVNSAGGNLNAFAQQTALRYATGDVAQGIDPNITTGAYDNNLPGLARTTFYMLDYARDTLVTIADRTATGSSNTGGGLLKTIGRLVEPNGNLVNISAGSGLDIVTTPEGRNIAVGYTQRRLFCVDLAKVNPDLALGSTQNVTINPVVLNLNNGFGSIEDRLIDIAIPPRTPTAADAAITVARFGSNSASAKQGEVVSFAVKLRNNGPSIANGLQVTLAAEQGGAGLLTISNLLSGGASCNAAAFSPQVFCRIPALLSGKEINLTFDVSTKGGSSSSVNLTTRANISGPVPDPNTGNNTSTNIIRLSR